MPDDDDASRWDMWRERIVFALLEWEVDDEIRRKLAEGLYELGEDRAKGVLDINDSKISAWLWEYAHVCEWDGRRVLLPGSSGSTYLLTSPTPIEAPMRIQGRYFSRTPMARSTLSQVTRTTPPAARAVSESSEEEVIEEPQPRRKQGPRGKGPSHTERKRQRSPLPPSEGTNESQARQLRVTAPLRSPVLLTNPPLCTPPTDMYLKSVLGTEGAADQMDQAERIIRKLVVQTDQELKEDLVSTNTLLGVIRVTNEQHDPDVMLWNLKKMRFAVWEEEEKYASLSRYADSTIQNHRVTARDAKNWLALEKLVERYLSLIEVLLGSSYALPVVVMERGKEKRIYEKGLIERSLEVAKPRSPEMQVVKTMAAFAVSIMSKETEGLLYLIGELIRFRRGENERKELGGRYRENQDEVVWKPHVVSQRATRLRSMVSDINTQAKNVVAERDPDPEIDTGKKEHKFVVKLLGERSMAPAELQRIRSMRETFFKDSMGWT